MKRYPTKKDPSTPKMKCIVKLGNGKLSTIIAKLSYGNTSKCLLIVRQYIWNKKLFKSLMSQSKEMNYRQIRMKPILSI